MAIRRAMLFAAGLGTRMRPLTNLCPKPLVRVAGKALIDYLLDRFEAQRIERVVVNTHYRAEDLSAYLRGQHRSFELVISHEPELLDTGGGIVRAQALLGDEPFYSANADAFWVDEAGNALQRLEAAYDSEVMDGLLLLASRAESPGYHGPGNFSCDATGKLRWDANGMVFTGLQVLHPRLFRGRSAAAFSLRALYEAASAPNGQVQGFFGLAHAGRFMHVGSPAELAEVEADLRARPPVA